MELPAAPPHGVGEPAGPLSRNGGGFNKNLWAFVLEGQDAQGGEIQNASKRTQNHRVTNC